jgi:hypothetical protein
MDLVSKVQMLINEGLFEERPCIILFVNTSRNTVLIGERPAASIHGLVLGWSETLHSQASWYDGEKLTIRQLIL